MYTIYWLHYFMFILSTSNLHKIHWNFLLWRKPSSGLKACFTFVNLLKRLLIHVYSPHSETKLQGQLQHRVSITSMQHHQVQTGTKRALETHLPQPPFNQHCSFPQMATLTANANSKRLTWHIISLYYKPQQHVQRHGHGPTAAARVLPLLFITPPADTSLTTIDLQYSNNSSSTREIEDGYVPLSIPGR